MKLRLLVLYLAAVAVRAASPGVPSVDAAFNRLYNFDFRGAERLAGQYIASNSSDPMGYTARAAGLLFRELNRRDTFGDAKWQDEGRVRDGKAQGAEAAVRAEFWGSIETAELLARARLAADPKDRDGLLSMTIASGLKRDYTALIDKKLRQSMEYIKEAQAWSTRLLAVDPGAADAYLNKGFSEYLLGSFPAVLRWVVKIEGVEGSKERGFAQLELVASNGRYLKPFAQMMLASFYQKEGRGGDSARLLRDMLREYPENPVIRREVARLGAGQ